MTFKLMLPSWVYQLWLLVKFNTPVPSSAAVERIFSVGKDILRAEKTNLSDETFHRLMFLKGNKHFVKSLDLAKEAQVTGGSQKVEEKM
jgi:hypothetical protein